MKVAQTAVLAALVVAVGSLLLDRARAQDDAAALRAQLLAIQAALATRAQQPPPAPPLLPAPPVQAAVAPAAPLLVAKALRPEESAARDGGMAPSGGARFAGVRIEDAPAHVASDFRAEPVDPSWAHGTEDAIRGSLAKLAARDVEVGSVECRARTCKLSATFPDHAARMDFLRDGFQRNRESGFAEVNLATYAPPPRALEGGRVEGEIYFFRDGF